MLMIIASQLGGAIPSVGLLLIAIIFLSGFIGAGISASYHLSKEEKQILPLALIEATFIALMPILALGVACILLMHAIESNG